eukprot:PhM_4_TR1951/c0_g1_i1/m.40087/K19036/IGHMBP2; ATP-dependent RNA/DNA helicase IGHMBP2
MASLDEIVTKWCSKQRQMLKEEEQAAELRMAQKKGIVGEVSGLESSVGGKYLVTVAFTRQFCSIAESYKPGDTANIVQCVGDNNNNNKESTSSIVHGVVVSTGGVYIVLSVDEQRWDCSWMEVRISATGNRIIFSRIHTALGGGKVAQKTLGAVSSVLCPEVVQIVFTKEKILDTLDNVLPSAAAVASDNRSIEFVSQSLNESQKVAVRMAVAAKYLHLIHGPPGTGKTTTLCEVIRQLVIVKKQRVLVCAPSNVAIDNILDKLMNNTKDSRKGIRPLRIGDVARVSNCVSAYALEEQLQHTEERQLVMDVKRDMDKALKESMSRRRRGEELRALRQELRERETRAVDSLKKQCNLFACTVNSASSYLLDNEAFDVVIIDEAAQSTHAECWIAMLRAKKVILAGDPYQLPPTVLSENPALESTVFEALIKKYDDNVSLCTLLDTQYRMHDDICRWSSNEFYKGRLTSHESVAALTLEDEEGIDGTSSDFYELGCPIVFIDTCNAGFCETVINPYDSSKVNHGEANVVVSYIHKLIKCGVSLSQIGVVTPYAAQSSLVKDMLRNAAGSDGHSLDPDGFVEVSTVDAFQGREKLVIIMSFVRCNTEGQLGFLTESRRVNVALTRAMRQLVVVGDSNTLRTDKFLRRLCEYLDEVAVVGDVE